MFYFYSVNKSIFQVAEIARSDISDECFYTKAFVIRFQEETIPLNDVCVFRVDYDNYPFDKPS